MPNNLSLSASCLTAFPCQRHGWPPFLVSVMLICLSFSSSRRIQIPISTVGRLRCLRSDPNNQVLPWETSALTALPLIEEASSCGKFCFKDNTLSRPKQKLSCGILCQKWGFFCLITLYTFILLEFCQNHPSFGVRLWCQWQGEGQVHLPSEQPGDHQYRHPVGGACRSAHAGCPPEIGAVGYRDHNQLPGGLCQVIDLIFPICAPDLMLD